MWTPTLDDVINAPRDSDDLRMHLQSVGALPTDLRPATLASPPIQQLVPPNIPPSGPAVPLRPPTRMDTAMKTSELAEPSGTMTPPIVSSPDAISSGGPVKPMTAPTLTGGPGAFPGMESSSGLPMGTPGTAQQTSMLPFYQSQFDRAAAANRPDSMSDHPSFLGKVGHVLGRVGNVALNAFVPGLAETIPGTDAYKVATEQRAKRELAGEQERESKEKLQTAETAEAEARAKALLNPPDKEKQSMDYETFKDLMEGDNGKPRINPDSKQPYTMLEALEATKQAGAKPEKLPEGEYPLGQRVPQLNEALNRRFQVMHPGMTLPAEYQLPANSTQKDFDRIDKIMQQEEQAHGTEAQRREANGFRAAMIGIAQEAAAERREKTGEDIVTGFDKDGKAHLTSRANAKEMGLNKIHKSNDADVKDANFNYKTLNDMGARAMDVYRARHAMDQNPAQSALIKTALSGHKDDWSTMGAKKLMSEASKEYVDSVFTLREASLSQPKLLTGGSRVSDPQVEALYNTVPGSSGNSKDVARQLRKFNSILDRMWEGTPVIEGQNKYPVTFDEAGGAGTAGAPGPPAAGMKWQQNKRTGEYRQVPEKP